jgi:UDP-N-acetylglucosamine transferase subunit ALG13
MIFVTVGTQMPFDRLIRGVDRWARARGRRDVIAQTGPTGYRPAHLKVRPFVESGEFRQLVEDCEVMVAHAGIGSILTALDLGKRVLVMPRRALLGEHRNEHQLATVRNFAHLAQVRIVEEEADLPHALDTLLALNATPGERSEGRASQELLSAVRVFLSGGEVGISHEA